jgi:PAS domain S-box-containing protein
MEERHLAGVLDMTPLATIVYDANGVIAFVNARAAAILAEVGLAGDLIGSSWETVFPHLKETPFPTLLREALDAPVGRGPTVPLLRGYGSYRLLLRRVTEDHVGAFFVPVSELEDAHVAAELARLQAVEDDYTQLRSLYPFGSVAVFDNEFRYLEVEGQGWKTLGVDPARLVGKRFDELWDEATTATLRRLAKTALAGRQERAVVAHDDAHWEIWAGPLSEADDGTARGVFVSRDASRESAHMTEALLLRAAIDAASLGVAVLELRGSHRPIIFSSRGFRELTGRPVGELAGAGWSVIRSLIADRTALVEIEAAIAGGSFLQRTVRTRRKSGELFWTRLSVGRFSSDPGGTRYLALVLEDVTAIRQAEIERDHARRLMELGSLAGTVAHDFNNILMEIQGRAELCRESGWTPDVVAHETAGILASIGSGSELSAQLLRYARHYGHEVADDHGSGLVRDQMEALRRVLPVSVDLVFDGPDEPVPVGLAPAQLERILLNLVKNGADAMPDGGALRIELRQISPDRAEVRVIDEGEGMPARVLERAMHPFFTTKGDRGTGLGLATIRSIVEAADGTVQLESEPGAGTTVVLELPIRDLADSAGEPESAGAEALDTSGLRGLRVLVAEDSAGIRQVIQRMLIRHGSQVVTAADGVEALRSFETRGPFDVVLADHQMPGMTGGRLLTEIHGRPGGVGPRPHLVLMTGDLGEAETGLPAAVTRLEKPFEITSFLTLLSALASSSGVPVNGSRPAPPPSPDREPPHVPEPLLNDWQELVNLLAELAGVPAGLIMRVVDEDIEVLVASQTDGNPYAPGERERLADSGLYCEAVIRSGDELVPDAMADPEWDTNPDIERGMISYFGLPIRWPDGSPFGTLCILSGEPTDPSNLVRRLMARLRDLMERELELLYGNALLGVEKDRLIQHLEDLDALNGLIPICSRCKMIYAEDGAWRSVEHYVARQLDARFSHGLCPVCAEASPLA